MATGYLCEKYLIVIRCIFIDRLSTYLYILQITPNVVLFIYKTDLLYEMRPFKLYNTLIFLFTIRIVIYVIR